MTGRQIVRIERFEDPARPPAGVERDRRRKSSGHMVRREGGVDAIQPGEYVVEFESGHLAVYTAKGLAALRESRLIPAHLDPELLERYRPGRRAHPATPNASEKL